MEDFRSFLEMLWRPLIFVWGVELRIQRPFRLMKLCLFVVIFPLFLQPSSQAPFYEFLRPLSSGICWSKAYQWTICLSLF
ncbi:unnamed protein product [Prunus brigantina]